MIEPLVIGAVSIAAFWVGLIVGVNVGESWAASGGRRNDETQD